MADTVVSCPTCKKEVPWGPQSPWRPFCSERCRMIDLGDWIEERHRITDPDSVDQETESRPEGKE